MIEDEVRLAESDGGELRGNPHTPPRDDDRGPDDDPDLPKSLPAFVARFSTDEACSDYLFKLRYPEGFVCPKCGDTHGTHLAWDGGRWIKCRNGHKTSITSGTVLHRTKQPLTKWFYAAYIVATLTPGISALQFQKQLALTRYETAFQMLHKLRSALVAPDREPLRGEVEIDEALIGGREEGRPGRSKGNKALVVVAVEIVRYVKVDKRDPTKGVEATRAGRARIAIIPNAEAATLLPWIEENVEKGATILTDGWQGYNGLDALGYKHQRVLQSSKGKSTGAFLPMVHLIISNLKRWLLGTHKGAIANKHLQAYLNEFTYRFNRRFWRGPAFLRALGLSMNADERPEYQTLYRAGSPEGWRHPNSTPPAMSEMVREVIARLDAETAEALSSPAAMRKIAELIKNEIKRQRAQTEEP